MSIELAGAEAVGLNEALFLLSRRDYKFNEQAIRTVQAHRDAAIPRLIEAIENSTTSKCPAELVLRTFRNKSLSAIPQGFRTRSRRYVAGIGPEMRRPPQPKLKRDHNRSLDHL
jgi:hypothetical protein